MDLQRDFLDAEDGRMPVEPAGASGVIATANAILAKQVLAECLPILIINQFPVGSRLANLLRKGAAVAGTRGAELDARIRNNSEARVFAKARSSAFTNPELEPYLRSEGVSELYVMGVFAEGCVRSTVIDAIRLGYPVSVIAGAIATNASWKKRFALWTMKRAGGHIVPSVLRATVT